MSNIKVKLKEVVELQPDDATYAEIVRELALGRLVERGMLDSNGMRHSRQRNGEVVALWGSRVHARA
tara:strand:- start:234 stop:434 length:201 start_codon:yes stop_codon:yes gene_type:complete